MSIPGLDWLRSAWRRSHPEPPPPSALVPEEVKKASHDLRNAVTRAKWHMREAERSLHPVEEMIRKMRGEEQYPTETKR